MASTLRLYGPAVGIGTAIADVDVTGITPDGDAVLTPQDSTFDQFTLNSDRVSELFDNGLAYDKADIDASDSVWGAIEDVETHYRNDDDNREHYFEAARRLFKGGP